MSNNANPADVDQLIVYEIKVEGHLSHEWTDWFGGLNVALEDSGDTRLTGPVMDQAALYRLLKKVRDLGMPLVSVNRINCKTQKEETK